MTDEVVITGMSGRFPECDNIEELSQNLYNKIDLTSESRRWKPGLYGIPKKMGQLKDLSKFDNQFFGVHHKQAHLLDPQIRILLESTYESIVDAGYDPNELRGKNIGVFIGNCYSESDEFFSMDPKKINGFSISGCTRSMFANRISYTFDFKGPSFPVDTACSSSAFALYEAVRAICTNECEAAIVGGASLCLKPAIALNLYKLNILSNDGHCKTFDDAADGCGRAEAVATLFLQKAEVARRKYATIVHIKTNNDGFKEEGITYPSSAMHKQLYREVYKQCNVDPLQVSYIEAHGTGTHAGDPVEISAIADVFCKGRKEPLKVGTLKSNIGHSEAVSGICGVIKIIIAMEKCVIPPNLHFNTPNSKIKSLIDGQIKVVAESTPWEGEYAAFNSFGFGGVNVHGVLQSNANTKFQENSTDGIPQLVLYSGRTEESIYFLFDYIEKNKAPREFFALLHKSVYASPQKKAFRGFKLLSAEQSVAEIKKPSEERPLWYIFSGGGTQWPAMAKHLMQLDVFAESIRKSADVLKSYELDLLDILTNEVKYTFHKNITHTLVSIVAVQIALVDTLNELGLKPDGYVGHSLGELGCAYVGGCLTAEQAILAAYWRGRAVEESSTQDGSMAALGMTWSEAYKCCPKDISLACHNAENSVTISGPKESIKSFTAALKADNVSACDVDCCGYAFHSQYILPATDKYQAALEKIIPNPKSRTSQWISSSYPSDLWNDPKCKTADASYFVHNLISPVLFYEALQCVPKNAIVVEIAPHNLLYGSINQVIGTDAVCIGLMKKYVDDTTYFLSSIGRLYTFGLNPDIERLYPPVQFPVPKSTPMISPLIKWDHSESWTVAKWDENTKCSTSATMILEINPGPEDSPNPYFYAHYVDGFYTYPPSAYIIHVWQAFAEINNTEMIELPITLENVKIHRPLILSETAPLKLTMDISSSGNFEISEGGLPVFTGHVFSPQTDANPFVLEASHLNKEALILSPIDIYQELKLKACEYSPSFKGIILSDLEGNEGLLKWSGDWVTLLDTIFQFTIFGGNKRAFSLFTGFQTLTIDPFVHNKVTDKSLEKYQGISIHHDKVTGEIISGGVLLKKMKYIYAPRQSCKQIPILETHEFVPYNEPCLISKSVKTSYQTYIKACSALCRKIYKLSGKSLSQPPNGEDDCVTIDEEYLKSCANDHILLKTLHGIMNTATSTNLPQDIKSYVNSYLLQRDDDILAETLVSEKPLRSLVDIVIENLTSKKIKVGEICQGRVPLTTKVNHFIQTFSSNVNYCIAHPNEEMLEKKNLPPHVDLISWKNNFITKFNDANLIILKYLNFPKNEFKSNLKSSSASLKNDGFILVLQRTNLIPAEIFLSTIGEICIPVLQENELEEMFEDLNLIIVSKKSDSLASTAYLLRKTPVISYKDSILNIVPEQYDNWVVELKDKMATTQNSSGPERIWLLSNGKYYSGILGLVTCLRHEPGGSSVRCIFAPEIKEISSVALSHLFRKNLVMNVLKGGNWGSYRHKKYKEGFTKRETEHAYLSILTPGNLSSLAWVDSPLKYYTASAKAMLCQVYYSSLNDRDIVVASGQLSCDTIPEDLAFEDSILGMEFSGRLMDGERVMGIISHQALATAVAADPCFLWDVPSDWTLEEAATVPLAYSTAFYALIVKGNLKKKQKVLIQSGGTDVGQAAIAIALSLECETYVSIGSPKEQEFLKRKFPQLEKKNFCNSGDTSFEKHVLKHTNGKGVDVILNMLASDTFKASLNCLAYQGEFLEIGTCDLINNTSSGMAILPSMKRISYHNVSMDFLLDATCPNSHIKKEVSDLVIDGISSGVVQPLSTIVFHHDQAEQAFQYAASGQRMGKVVIKIKGEECQDKIIPSPIHLTAVARSLFNPTKSYIIIGGLGGVGLELCQWLIDRGAKNIILTSRSGVKSGYQKICLHRWKQSSVNIEVSTLNAVKFDDARQLMLLGRKFGPVAAIFNLTMVLRDALMENQTLQNFLDVCDSKVKLTKNLDTLSREFCPELEWFVCFSSGSSGKGIPGQSNYGYANSVMERICEKRSREGLPGMAIQWGAIADVGYVENNFGADVDIGGTMPQRIISCLHVLDEFLQQSHPVVSSYVPYQPSTLPIQKASKSDALTTVAKMFGIKNVSSLNLETSLGELGLDSLIGFELRWFLENEFELRVSMAELRQFKLKDLQKLEYERK